MKKAVLSAGWSKFLLWPAALHPRKWMTALIERHLRKFTLFRNSGRRA
jgi:hypothetical protein